MQERNDKWSVGEWMTPNPMTISPDLSVKAAFFKMRTENIRHLVVEEDGRLIGIVTDRDLRRPDISDSPDVWDEFYKLDDEYEVRYVMTTSVKTLRSGDHLEKAIKLFLDYRFGAIPIIDKRGSVIGILSTHDVMKAFGEILKDHGDTLRNTKG